MVDVRESVLGRERVPTGSTSTPTGGGEATTLATEGAPSHARRQVRGTLDAALGFLRELHGSRVPGPLPRDPRWEEDRTSLDGTPVHVARMPPRFASDLGCSWRAYLYDTACTEPEVRRLLWRMDLHEDAVNALRTLIAEPPGAGATSGAKEAWIERVCNWTAVVQCALNVRSPGFLMRRFLSTRYAAGVDVAAPGYAIPLRGMPANPEASPRWLGGSNASAPACAPQGVLDLVNVCVRAMPPAGGTLLMPYDARSWSWDVENERPHALVRNVFTGETGGPSLSERPPRVGVDGNVPIWRGRSSGPSPIVALSGESLRGYYVMTDENVLELFRRVATHARRPYAQAWFDACVAWFDYLQTFDLSVLGLTPEQLEQAASDLAAARAEAAAAAREATTGSLLAGFAAVAGAAATTGVGAIFSIVVIVLAVLVEVLVALVGYASGSSCPPFPGPLLLRTLADPRCIAVASEGRVIGDTVLGTIESATVGGLTVPRLPEALDRALDVARRNRAAAQAAGDEKAASLATTVAWVAVAIGVAYGLVGT